MNANAIFRGGEYAYVDYPSRNVTYYPGARRVRVMYVYKVEDEWRQRKQTLVEVEVLDNDTGESNGNVIKTLRARQIVARWDEHVVEQERHRAREDERRRVQCERNEEIQQQREERERVEKESRERIYVELESIGIPRNTVTVNSYEVRISRHRLDELLKGGVNNHNGEGVRQ